MIAWAVYLAVAGVIAAIPTGMLTARRNRSVLGWIDGALSVPVPPLRIVWPRSANGGDVD